MEYTTAYSATIVLLVFYLSMLVHAEDLQKPVASSQVSNQSRYHQQIDFISKFLLQSRRNVSDIADNTSNTGDSNSTFTQKQSSYGDKSVLSSAKDNNTTPNEIQVIPVPAAVSSAIDTLPVHPRIPRRSPARRRSRNDQHRHSTRVFQGQPVRYLLPPFENEIHLDTSSTIPPFSTNPILNSSLSTSSSPQSTTEAVEYNQDLSENKLVQRDPKQIVTGPQYRRVFIPPPLRYLLPPFFYENYINAQPSTTSVPVTQGNSADTFTLLTEEYYYTTNSSLQNQNNGVESSSSLAPIIVVETVSQSDNFLEDWNYPGKREEFTTSVPTDYSFSEPVKEVDENNPSTSPLQNQFSSTTVLPQQYSESLFLNPSQYKNHGQQNLENFSSGIALSSISPKFSSPSIPLNIESTNVYGRYKTTAFENYPSRSTVSIPSATSTSYPFLRGPNLEQALFETGDFQTFNISNSSQNVTEESTLTMMNRPLLAQEVAQAGMKITAHLKKEQISKDSINRGKSRFNHLNQFNFQNEINSRGIPKSSQLVVAETSYYNGRRASKQLVQEADIRAIPGRAGQDYPTFAKPPARSSFSCHSVKYHRGYVADPSTGCQVFYICVGNGPGEPMLCPNGTIFSQDFLVCDWWYNVDCQQQT